MLLFIMVLDCFSSILDMVIIDNEFMCMIAKRLAQYSNGLSGRFYVSMVLRYNLPMDALYMTGSVVDRGCDNPIESFVFHPPYVERVEHGYEERPALFFFFLSNVLYA